MLQPLIIRTQMASVGRQASMLDHNCTINHAFLLSSSTAANYELFVRLYETTRRLQLNHKKVVDFPYGCYLVNDNIIHGATILILILILIIIIIMIIIVIISIIVIIIITYTKILLKSVAVIKLQVAILARSSREMSQTVRID